MFKKSRKELTIRQAREMAIKVEKTERGALIYIIPRNNHVIKYYDTSGGTWLLWARDKKYLK